MDTCLDVYAVLGGVSQRCDGCLKRVAQWSAQPQIGCRCDSRGKEMAHAGRLELGRGGCDEKCAESGEVTQHGLGVAHEPESDIHRLAPDPTCVRLPSQVF